MTELPKFLQDKLNSPPAAGSGVHDWIFNVARYLHACVPAGEIETLIRSRLSNCGRIVPDREIKTGIKNAFDYCWKPGANAGQPAKAKPAVVNPGKIQAIVEDGIRLPDLWHLSPFWYESPQTETIIDTMFPGDPLLCCGLSVQKFDTKKREDWRGQMAGQQFIVPSPMCSPTGKTQEGKESAHCIANTGPRRFLVVEFDFSEFARDGKTPTTLAPLVRHFKSQGVTVPDMCAALLWHLKSFGPLALVVSSGGKSLHGWFFCKNVSEPKLKTFFDGAITVGADPKTWLRSQFVRMPDGTRDNGKSQDVFYFDPNKL